MRRRLPGTIECHWEKAALALSSILTLWLAWAFLLESPNRVMVGERNLAPGELHQIILRETEALQRCLEAVETPRVEVPSFGRRLKDLHGRSILSTKGGASGSLGLGRLRLAAAFGRIVEFPAANFAPLRIVRPMVTPQPRVFTGRCLLAGGAVASPPDHPDTETKECGWVRIVTRFDRARQRAAFLAAGYPEHAAGVYLVAVEAQRQELLPDGGCTPWVMVRSAKTSLREAIPTPAVDERGGRVLNADALAAALAEVKAAQVSVACPSLGSAVAGDGPAVPASGEVPGVVAGSPAGALLVWIDDTRVEPGRRYRYRVRVVLWNRFVGRRSAVVRAADAMRAVIESEWSPASEPIRAAPRTHFFVLGPSVNRPAANVEVWKWHQGRWLRKLFTVAVGELIGAARAVRLPERDQAGRLVREVVDFSTGVTLLDLRGEQIRVRVASGERGRFGWVTRSTLVAVCLDAVSGRLEERSHIADRTDALRERLRRRRD
jgi:hypothetical protein